MAEEQALDRVHRIGQTRPVTAIRYIVSESVEYVGHFDSISRRSVSLTVLVTCAVCGVSAEEKIGSDPAVTRAKCIT